MTSYRKSEYPRREPSLPGVSSAQLGMYVGLGSLSVLFAASLVGYFVTRYQNDAWRDAELPALPVGLWFNTAILVGLSVAMHYAERRLATNDQDGFRRGLSASLVAAAVFLVSQVFNWKAVASSAMASDARALYAFTFYMLTVLHALHVLAGLVPLGVLFLRSGSYSSSRSEPLRLTRQYWDFLLVVWIVLFASLWMTS